MTNSLVKAASSTINTNINNLSYTPLQLVTGKYFILPGQIIGNEVTESISETDAVQRVMERLLNTQADFRKADMRMKLKNCQGVKVTEYQH